jgi:hypothetical protein
MNATVPKPSRFWGTTPRRIKSLVHVLFVLLIGSVLAIGILCFRDFIWKFEAKHYASQAGIADAIWNYAHGRHRILEVALMDESGKNDTGPVPSMYGTEPAGRQMEGYDIYLLYISPGAGAPQRISAETYVKEFNHWMRTICENPDWFGPNGERLPDPVGTNRPPFKRVPE